jgi:hypothetical protein
MGKNVSIKATKYIDGFSYKYKGKKIIIVISDSEKKETNILFKRLFVVNTSKQREELLKLNSHETTLELRPHSKYGIITSMLNISHPSLECLHHGIGEILKLYKNDS